MHFEGRGLDPRPQFHVQTREKENRSNFQEGTKEQKFERFGRRTVQGKGEIEKMSQANSGHSWSTHVMDFICPKSGPKCYKPKLAKVGWAKEGFGQSRLWPFLVFTIGTLIVEIILIMFFNILENAKKSKTDYTYKVSFRVD